MKQIWNTFCEDISKNKGVKEMTFEKEIVKGFLQALGWSRYDGNLEEQYGLYNRKWIPDFVFYLNNDKNAKEIILELKKPDHKQRKVDIEQIEAYMKLTDCRFGLYFGEKLEVFYLEEKDGKRSAASVTTIDWTIDNEAGANLIELLDFKNYDRKKLEQFCLDNIYLNTFLRHCKHQGGRQQLYDCIMEHFVLPESIAGSLQSRLKFTIVDNPEIEETISESTVPAVTKKQKNDKIESRPPKIWMIPANSKYFDHRACFDELGKIYWKQYNKIQVGDMGYIYYSAPVKRIIFKFLVLANDLPYIPDYDAEGKFYKKVEDFEEAKKHNRFYVIKRLGEHTNNTLTLANMMQHGLKWAPQGALNLSDKSYDELRKFIEDNF